MRKKTYLLDTSAILTDRDAISAFGRNDVLIPLKVLEEIDNNKKRQDTVGAHARGAIRILDSLREKGSLQKGVRIEKGKGLLFARAYDPKLCPAGLDIENADTQIIVTALTELAENPTKKLIVVSRDINMRVKCDALGILCEDYKIEQIVKDRAEIYTGFSSHLIDDEIIDRFYSGEDVFLEGDHIPNLYPHEYVMLVSSSNEKKSALARCESQQRPLKKVSEYRNGVWGIKPRNKEQSFAFDLLLNPEIKIITLIGRAGSGKTLCAIAAGLSQTLEYQGRSGNKAEPLYKKLVVSRPIQPVGKDIGFLPGSMEDKMMPWLAPIQDNLQYLMGNDKLTLESYLKSGTIEMEAITYIRGRSISDAFIMIDEAQNLTTHELKTILTRVGENTKIVLTGDIEQIDNTYINETTNGLTYAVEKFKNEDLAGHIILQKGERSKVATLAAKLL
jgi:PhoH-like ATPase